MLTKILSAAHFGLEATPIEVEVNVFKKGFPGFSIIDLDKPRMWCIVYGVW